jgi:hypothetical protein
MFLVSRRGDPLLEACIGVFDVKYDLIKTWRE